MGDNCCEAARNGDSGAGDKGCVGENLVICWKSVCGKQENGRKDAQSLQKTRQRTRNEDLRSAHKETGSTHNKSVARATETVVRTTRTCGWMLHGVGLDGCCSPGCTVACGGGCGVAPAAVAAAAVVGGAAGGGYPKPTGCMGKRVTLKYPCSAVIQKGKCRNKKIENAKKNGEKSNKPLCLSMHLQLEAHLKCVVIARYF